MPHMNLSMGDSPRRPLNILKHSWIAPEKSTSNVHEYVTTIQKRLEEMTTIAHGYQELAKSLIGIQARPASGVHCGRVCPRSGTSCSARTNFNFTASVSCDRLKRWYTPTADRCLVSDGSLEVATDIPTWKEGEDPPIINPNLSAEQRCQLLEQHCDYAHVLSDVSGKTTLISHKIHTGSAHPIAVPPRRTPQAYRDITMLKVKAYRAIH